MATRNCGSDVGRDMRTCGRGVLGPCLQFVATLLGACASAFAQTAGTLTLAEGSVELIRGATLYTATQGVRLGDGDILSIDPKGQAQIEFLDGAILNLSQGARAMLTNIASGRRGQSEVAVLSALAGFFLGELCPAGQYRDLRLAAPSRRDFRQHGARALAEIEDRAVLEFYLRLPFGVDRQYVSVSQPHTLGGGVERRAPYQLHAPFGQRQGARGLSESGSGSTGAQ